MVRIYEAVDAHVFRQHNDALEFLPLPAWIPVTMLETISLGYSSADVTRLTSARLDVILDLTPAESSELASVARYGVWTVRQADEMGRTGDPWLFHSMYDGTVFRTSVEADRGGPNTVLYESYGASDWVSLNRARNRACWKALSAILSRLRMLASGGWAELEAMSVSFAETPPDREPPSAPTILRHTARVAMGVTGRRLQKLVLREDWFIATRPRTAPAEKTAVPSFTPIASPSTHYFADPFPIIHDERTYLFFESYSRTRRRGSIWYVPLDQRGRPVAEPQPALERDYHLSYPFLFTDSGEFFMIPESADHGTVDLYRAARFPDEWQLEQTLFSGVRAVDATVCVSDGRLFLFMNIAEEGASLDDELHVFCARTLHGPWRPHRANPVVSDVRSARPAGRLFWSHDQLIRPSQDCSNGYGTAIVLNRIDVLTEREYKESVVRRIEPRWMRGVSRTHTFNALDALEVIDGVRGVPRHRPTALLASLRRAKT